MSIGFNSIWKLLPVFWGLLCIGCSANDDFKNITTDSEIMEERPIFNDSQTLRTLSKEEILDYFSYLIEQEQILVGQQCGNAPDSMSWYYTTYVDMLADETGRHVGLIGADLGWFSGEDYPVQTLIDHWNKGGLVTVSWHADNPFVDGVDVYWDTVNDKDQINLKSLLKDKPQTKAWKSYRTELDKVAGALQKLKDAGVMVIWRPFHEMNGDFFWWGANANYNRQTNEDAFKALWIDLYNTLRWDYSLDNLIWMYSVVPSEGWYADVKAYYPGTDYVDIVGMDYYGTEMDFPHYEELKSLGKPVVMSESGPREEGYGQWNMMEWADLLRGKAAYFLQWHSWNGAKVAIRDNKNTMEMMNSTNVITLEEVLPNPLY